MIDIMLRRQNPIDTLAPLALALSLLAGCASTERASTTGPTHEPNKTNTSAESTAEADQSDTATAQREDEAEPAKPIDPKSDVLKHWRLVEDVWFDTHGKVYEKDGAIIIGAGKPASGISWLGPVLRNNYEIVLEAMRVEGSDFFCGLTFPVDESYCTLILGGWGGWTVGLSNVDSMHAAENETTRNILFKNKQWYVVKVRVTDDRIQVWLDDELEIDLPREGRRFDIWAEQEPVRPLGIATWYTTGAIRNFKLRRVKPWP